MTEAYNTHRMYTVSYTQDTTTTQVNPLCRFFCLHKTPNRSQYKFIRYINPNVIIKQSHMRTKSQDLCNRTFTAKQDRVVLNLHNLSMPPY